MGALFYGRNADKAKAQQEADGYAKRYKKGKCYTPSSRIPNACSFDSATGLWTCVAKAHHHWGSCGSLELTSDPGRGTPWEVSIPIPFAAQPRERDAGDSPAPAGEPATGPEQGVEEYVDAEPEDYVTA